MGDFNQLSQIRYTLVFEPPRNEEYGEILGVTPLSMKFQCFQLTEIMRQRNDHAFATALKNLSKVSLASNDLHLFKCRVCKPKKCLVMQRDFLQRIKQ